MDYKIINQLIPKSYQDELENRIYSSYFPWYFHDQISNTGYDTTRYYDSHKDLLSTNPPAFTHVVVNDSNINSSEIFMLVQPIFYFLEQKENIVVENILRIRIRKTLRSPDHKDGMYTVPHVDLMENDLKSYFSLVYYVNDSDGDTILFQEKWNGVNVYDKLNIQDTSKPIKGNAVLFNGYLYHAGNAPVLSKDRTIINFDFTIKNENRI